MTIVRELVTRLGFEVDKTGIQQFNQQIFGFKTKATVAAAVVGKLIYESLASIRSVGNVVQDLDILSDRTGIAFEKLVGLQEAAKQFRISPEQFSGALQSFSKMVNEAKFGIGNLFKLSRDLKVSIRDVNGNLKETDQLFFEIVDQISRIGDEKVRIEAFAKVFGDDVAGKFNKFFKDGSKGARELADSYRSIGDALSSQKEVFEEFEKNLSAIETELQAFKNEIVISITPVITDVLGGINDILLKGRNELGGGILGGLESIGKAITESFLTLIDAGTVENFRENGKQEREEFNSNLQKILRDRIAAKIASTQETFSQQAQSLNTGTTAQTTQNINIDTNVQIEVPLGTPEAQQTALKESVEEAFRIQSQDMIRQLLNNNPQVE